MTQAASSHERVTEVYVCDAVRTPFGRYGGSLASVRTDDLAAIPIRALAARHPALDPDAVDEVFLGCANQAGEDNRNVARMAALLVGPPDAVPAATVNGCAALGWTPLPSPPERFEAARQPSSSRAASRACRVRLLSWGKPLRHLPGQQRSRTRRSEEIVAVQVPQAEGETLTIDRDEQPRPTSTLDGLSRLKPIVTADGIVTAGNSSGINDGPVRSRVRPGPRKRPFERPSPKTVEL